MRVQFIVASPLLQEVFLLKTNISKFHFSHEWQTKGAFHLPELTGQTIPIVMRISLLIKTIQPDQSNPK